MKSKDTRITENVTEPLRLHLNEPTGRGGNLVLCYPDAGDFIRAIAARLRVSEASLLPTTGADGALDAICRAAIGSAVILEPDFPRYRLHAENAGLAQTLVPVLLSDPLFPSEELVGVVSSLRPGLVLVSTIGNPTGYQLPQEIVERLREASPDSLIAIDEVYSEFTAVSYAATAACTLGVLSVGSVSKIGGAGLRAGFIVGHPETLDRVRRFVSRFAIAGLSLEAATDLLISPGRIEAIVERQKEARSHLARSLREQSIEVREGANWVLARFGPGSGALARELQRQGILVAAPEDPNLRSWLRISTPDLASISAFSSVLASIAAGPVVETGGLLELREAYLSPVTWLSAGPVMRLQGEVVEIDHYVITLPDTEGYAAFDRGLVDAGARRVEGPGVWPVDFCDELAGFPLDLWMSFSTFELPSGVLLVAAAPWSRGDQIDRFRQSRGARGVHHVAVRVDDVFASAEGWRKAGWSPLSPSPAVDTGIVQWFLTNPNGQIVELIARPAAGTETFTCSNLKALRASEAK